MEAYADEIDAEILVIAGRYRNPTSLKASKALKDSEERNLISWHPRVLDYLTANRHNVHKYLNVLADVKIQPTAENPLRGFEGFSGLESTVIGHPKQNLRSLPILEGYPHKILMSTGAVTRPNYTDTKSGKKGEFHHTYGFLVVEVKDNETFLIRNVEVCGNGEFTDLTRNVKDGMITYINECEGIVLGDLHCGSTDEDLIDATFDLMSELTPKAVVLHDVFDGYSISHHHEKDPFLKHKKMLDDKHLVDLEVDDMLSYLERFNIFDEVYIVKSNHDTHVDRYLRERDWKKDIANSLSYMRLATAILEGRAENGIIPYKISERYPEYTCLGLNDSLMIGGIECALHGDKGANGSRGSATQFKNLNVKTTTAHSHSPNMTGGSHTVGTSTHLRLEYNDGLSSWMHAHEIIDRNGKRQMIMFIDNQYTTL
jgi:hypothetical protein